MAILNNIRKQSLVLIAVIALALFSFVLADLFRNSDALSAKSQNVVATINGKDITREDFMQKVEAVQRQMGGRGTSTQAMNTVWNQELRQAVMQTQFDALGFTVEKDQMRDLLKTSFANNTDFQNEAGVFDENKLNEYIANLKETSSIAYQQWVDYEESIAANALNQNYTNMVKAGMIGTLAEGELEHKLANNTVDIKFVQVPYATIADDQVTVSDSEITNYMNKNKKQYTVEASRNINYVEFKEVASLEDENVIKESLTDLLKDQVVYNEVTKRNDTIVSFLKAKDNESYINANSDIKYDDRFIQRSGLPSSVADSIFNLGVGEVFGPYKDANHFKISKVVAVTQLPDSVKARHILIPFIGSRSATAETVQTKEQAKTTADSLMNIVKATPSKFVSLLDFSADTVSNEKEGVLDWFTYNAMVPEFRDFTFENNEGDVGVVESMFGYHVIEILGQKNRKRAIKVGTIARAIEPSEATVSKVFRDAATFEGAVADGNFQDIAKENNYTVRPVDGIKVLDENIPGLNSQRAIVRWAFEEGTKVGDTKKFPISNGFAVVQLTEKNKAGMMNVQDASVTALPAIRKAKKAEMIKNRISATTVEDVASAEGQSVRTALALNMKTPTVTGVGREPKVVGAAFGLNEGETSKLIAGENGVYMVQVTKVTPAVELGNYQAFANQVSLDKQSAVDTRLFEALKEAAEIEDNRANTVQ
ncbi:SurA N-terminal domain-containing protein [Oceanihabitans sediminis]|uniref:Periplasmic chaperone PpiD n=1 Tax=Oceanihabitans sediminis TaxID=1812012 RepID=A0A368P9A5_9FLAO|nr:SurA N-terminal domain-containing protein [Oceanihabitans sediminis]MDX1278192.1 SurA N-terminal domain-containing protein [Oceanihabitans sediminis]MDX1773935.1 SurA N-terminal domain-containing protein [Oceanihabitans sediminis]RBP32039.1 peptidylprolyl isomerase/peptidyl-prolyl cis-trans isomerase D [Oceanihabitans sediminis]RCU58694.1 peptidylprolyl isomerase [Oceanihabitans sediminis]